MICPRVFRTSALTLLAVRKQKQAQKQKLARVYASPVSEIQWKSFLAELSAPQQTVTPIQ